MRLSEVLKEVLPMTTATADPEITGVAHDSRGVEPGDLFGELGAGHAGHRFV